MASVLDEEFAVGLAELLPKLGVVEPIPVGDVATRRETIGSLQRLIHGMPEYPPDVTIQEFAATANDGADISLRWYQKAGAPDGPVVLYVHGGGMIASSAEIYDPPVARYVGATGVPFLSVDYRYAPEFPAPTPVTDCYAALQWLVGAAGDLHIDVDRIAVMGDSGGGGVAASLAIYARDHDGPRLAQQILVYPMLDDRNTTPDPDLAPFAPWTYDDNITGWTAVLGDSIGGPDVSPYAAAARLDDFTGLPPAYIEFGQMDVFRDEGLSYAHRLMQAGIETELHVHPGVPHGFDVFVPSCRISQLAMSYRRNALNRL